MVKDSEIHEDLDIKYTGRDRSVLYDAMNSSINALIIADMEGIIEYVNPSFLRMFEYDNKNDVLGKLAGDLFVDGKVKSFSDVEEIIDREEGYTEEFLAHRMDGSTFYVEVSSSTVKDEKGNAVGRMASFIDISERKATEDRNRKLFIELNRSQEQERQRIAQDLHDGIAQTIHAAKLNLIAFQKNPDKFKDRFKIGIEFIDKASQELREVCDDLYPSILKDYGLKSAIQWYARNYLEINKISSTLDISLEDTLDKDLEVHLFRIIKEVFSNIIRHAHCTRATLTLIQKKDSILLKISDNGKGFDVKKVDSTKQGFGLFSIKQRVEDFSGSLAISSVKGKGTDITIQLKVQDG